MGIFANSPSGANAAMEPRPAIASDASGEIPVEADSAAIETHWATRLLRVGACSLILYQSIYFVLSLALLKGAKLQIPLHLINIAVGFATLTATFAPPDWLRSRWERAAFGMCAGVTTGTTAIALFSGDPVQFFVVMLLFALGTGALLPWRSAWQFAFSAVTLVEFALVFGWPSSYKGVSEWMGILTAVGLSQCAVLVNERFRGALRMQVAMLRRGRELLRAEMAERARAEQKLRESETILRRMFDAAPDPILLVRLGDATFTEVNSAFETTGFTRAETIGKTTEQLGIWTRSEQREQYRRRLAADGLVRNMEMEWRCKDGRIIPALLSGAAVELNGELCSVNLMRDISHIKRTESELIAAREAALAASQSKSEFLSSMSHEIRTPMNAILGMAEMLAETALDPLQQRYLDVMRHNGNALLNLINDILDVAKVESGRLSLECADFDLGALTDKLGETLSVRAHEKGLELVVRIAPPVPLNLIGDALRLRQILINLVGNAIKFTEAGEVVVTIENQPGAAPGSLLFTVADTGIGIPADKLDQIFTPFTQADSSMARKYGGSGLGLAIVRRLVDLMGGRLWAESKLRVGSVFRFVIDFGVYNPPRLTADAWREELARIRVLVADDNASARAHLAEILREWGAAVDEAGGGRHALGLIDAADGEGRPYRLVVLDARMPGMNGFAVARELKRRGHSAIVMMLTADSLNMQLGLKRESGASAYLVKPVRRGELLQAVRVVIGSARRSEPIAAAPTAEEPIRERALRILLVEDSPDNRLVIRAYLKKMPYQIDEAENGEIGFRKFTAGDYDLILMDLQMPVTDGLTSMRMIREWERTRRARRTPIIALTASALEQDRRQSLAAGADTHVSKPVKKAALLAEIRAAVEDPAVATAAVAAAAAD
jgi:two-component system sensor histidine kinase/response regulator